MSAWPLPGGRDAWPVYRGSDAHIAAGEGPGVDLGNQLGLPLLAVHDGAFLSYGYESPDAGWFGDLYFEDGGRRYQLRYCHGRERMVPDTVNEWDVQPANVNARYPVTEGQVIGHVGYSGWTIPAGTGGSHLHLAMWRDGYRINPEEYLDTIGEGDTVPEGYVLIKRDDLQNLRDVANGWGEAAATDTGPYRLTVAKNRRQCSVELLDVAKAAQEALEQ